MKKYTPYIVILVITYLVAGFIRMQFNPAYWEQGARTAFIVVAGLSMGVYRMIKFGQEWEG